MRLTLAYSPCPNDCFMFDAIAHERIDLEGLAFDIRLADIEALNGWAFEGTTDVTKISFHAWAHCLDRYVLLDAGSALGRNCGPLLVSSRPVSLDDVAAGNLRIAIPGRFTTAHLLFGLAFPRATRTIELIFSDIEQAVLDGTADAGLIIHENRFTYESRGLRRIIDLGEWWESDTGAAIPLGGIVIRRNLPRETLEAMNRVMRRSVEYAVARREASLPYVRAHAQTMREDVMYQHIDLYVNDYSIDLGAGGRRAVELLFERGAATGRLPDASHPLFLS